MQTRDNLLALLKNFIEKRESSDYNKLYNAIKSSEYSKEELSDLFNELDVCIPKFYQAKLANLDPGQLVNRGFGGGLVGGAAGSLYGAAFDSTAPGVLTGCSAGFGATAAIAFTIFSKSKEVSRNPHYPDYQKLCMLRTEAWNKVNETAITASQASQPESSLRQRRSAGKGW